MAGILGMESQLSNNEETAEKQNWMCMTCGQGLLNQAVHLEHARRHALENRQAERRAERKARDAAAAAAREEELATLRQISVDQMRAEDAFDKQRRLEEMQKHGLKQALHDSVLADRKKQRAKRGESAGKRCEKGRVQSYKGGKK